MTAPSQCIIGLIEAAGTSLFLIISHDQAQPSDPGIASRRARKLENECPESDRLVEQTVGFHQSMLLGTRQDMDDIHSAILKIHENRQKLSSAR